MFSKLLPILSVMYMSEQIQPDQALVMVNIWVHCSLHPRGLLDSYSPSLPGYISCRGSGGHTTVRSLSPASSKLTGLVFTLATRVYKLQRVRLPFDGVLTVPCILKACWTRIYPRYPGI
ncbi:hypothetical protein LENED_008382 [Lentinula edodes]|uniref:Uncharacterized protein n=1 Tax=Lentinula edodes TaxID=5353 RepID=A0A1Q3EGW0_LENED|nr:hypothetical protein LENED_008382 [Lentinula edodes]